MKNSFIENIAQISNKDYRNILMDNDSPLISYEFLNALEESQSATKSNGWQPMHLMLKNKEDISGFLPLYLKNNSHGEFVFDHQWSYALKRAGRNYYPKLLSTIPFRALASILSMASYDITISPSAAPSGDFFKSEKEPVPDFISNSQNFKPNIK